MTDEDAIADDLRTRIAASPFHSGFGVEVEEARRGEVRLGWEARDERRNLQGLVHGGVLATLVDMAMGLAVRSVVNGRLNPYAVDAGEPLVAQWSPRGHGITVCLARYRPLAP